MAVGAGACAGCGRGTLAGWRFCEGCGLDLSAAVGPPRIRVSGRRDRHREVDLGVVAGGTDVGRVRRHNEDAVAIGTVGRAAVAVVCDGVSSVPDSDVAAVVAAAAGARVALERIEVGEVVSAAGMAALRAAAGAAAAEGDPADPEPPSCTYAAVVASGGQIAVSWVGDSRAYWIDGAGARALTVDDSPAGRLVAEGAPPDDPRLSDPMAHGLENWLGADAPPLPVRAHLLEPRRPGLVLVCSDGLSCYLDTGAVAFPGPGANPAVATNSLLRAAVAAGGRDNVSVAVLAVGR